MNEIYSQKYATNKINELYGVTDADKTDKRTSGYRPANSVSVSGGCKISRDKFYGRLILKDIFLSVFGIFLLMLSPLIGAAVYIVLQIVFIANGANEVEDWGTGCAIIAFFLALTIPVLIILALVLPQMDFTFG